MNWLAAVEAMRRGHRVRRRSEMWVRRIDDDLDETGIEACELMAGWTDDDKPVRVFIGRHSRWAFVPDDEDRAATDWEIVDG